VDPVLEHLQQVVDGCLLELVDRVLRVDVLDKQDEVERHVVLPRGEAAERHHVEYRHRRGLDGTELLVDEVDDLLVHRVMAEAVLGQDAGDGLRCLLTDAVEFHQHLPRQEHDRHDRRDAGLDQRLHQARVVPEDAFERWHVHGVRQGQRNHLFLLVLCSQGVSYETAIL